MASWGFGAGARVRGRLYDAGVLAARRASIRVISVGNLTTGGTGKTPLVIELASRLVAAGETVAVLARGYGARVGALNDELALVQARVPAARVYAGADRVANAERAAREGATVVLLDDGFQHRRLARDVDVLVIDATDPWGGGALLPRGLLREPVRAARRATHVVLSRVEQVDPSKIDELRQALDRAGVTAPVALLALHPGEPRLLHGAGKVERVVLLSGIGNPTAFERSASSTGMLVVGSIRRPDHHAFTAGDVAEATRRAIDAHADAVLVTEKDAVKLAPLVASAPVPFAVLPLVARLERAESLLAALVPETRALTAGVPR